jgi:predicted flap endonuclease-1-like 5' DNA nuclease
MTTKITFTLPAANVIGATECVLLGEFNNWDIVEGLYLTRQADGSMTAEVELNAGKNYQYRYLLSNGRWVNDDGEKITSEMNGYPVVNCIVRVPAVAKTVKPKKTIAAKTAPIKTKAATTSSKVSKTKTAGAKDNLTTVEGIGKKIEELLHKNNINSFKELSNATEKTLKEILQTGGSRFAMHKPGTWPQQAKLADHGKWDELEALQKQLKGGK